jgi:hypothetical protein
MRTDFPLVLAGIAIGFGMGDASATNLELKQLSSGASGQAIHALDPSLAQGAGFSALTSPVSAVKGEASLKGLSSPAATREALVRPEEGHAWRSGFAVFARVTRNDIGPEKALVAAPETGRPNGFAALKAPVERGATALSGLSARQDPNQDHLQRPAGTQWSNGFQGLR